MTEDSQIFEAYKPLRNRLRRVSIGESLYVVWAYMRHINFNESLPEDIEADRAPVTGYRHPKHNIHQWEFEILTREIIINGQVGEYNTLSLRRWRDLAKTIQNIRDIDEIISKLYVNQNNVLIEFHRKAHLQFPRYSYNNPKYLTRFYKIFSDAKMNELVEDTCTLTTHELFTIGILFLGAYLYHSFVEYPITITIKDLDIYKIDLFVSRFSKELSKLRLLIRDEQEMNDKYLYSYSLRAFPLIRMTHNMKDGFFCPLPPLLYWRITNGLYYEICDKKDFGMRFGHTFQKYR